MLGVVCTRSPVISRGSRRPADSLLITLIEFVWLNSSTGYTEIQPPVFIFPEIMSLLTTFYGHMFVLQLFILRLKYRLYFYIYRQSSLLYKIDGYRNIRAAGYELYSIIVPNVSSPWSFVAPRNFLMIFPHKPSFPALYRRHGLGRLR